MYKKNAKQASALLLSILIVSALLSSVFYINTFSTRQLSKANNIDNSLIAFYSAESGNERAIWDIRAYGDEHLTALNNSFTNNNALVTREVTSTIDSVFTALKEDEFYQFDLFDPLNIEYGSGLSYLSISWEDECGGSSWLELTANEWSSESNEVKWGLDESQIHVKKTLLNLDDDNLDQIDSIDGSQFNSNNAYQFRIKAMFCDVKNLTIRAYNSSDEQIPFKNIYTIRSVAQYPEDGLSSSNQALTVTLRRISPLSGLFDYVIFSEQSLIKDTDSLGSGWYSDEFYIAEPSSIILSPGETYNHEILLMNGIGPYTCKIIEGILPPDIILGDCIFSGKINIEESKTYPVTLEAEDKIGAKASTTLYFIIQK